MHAVHVVRPTLTLALAPTLSVPLHLAFLAKVWRRRKSQSYLKARAIFRTHTSNAPEAAMASIASSAPTAAEASPQASPQTSPQPGNSPQPDPHPHPDQANRQSSPHLALAPSLTLTLT